MNVSQKTKDLILELDKFSGSKLKNTKDLSLLIELADISQKDKLFYDIQFLAKYLNGLGKILKSGMTPASRKDDNGHPIENSKEKVMTEYKNNMEKLAKYLKDLILEADENSKAEFENKYLSLTAESLSKLTTIIYDLSWLKKFNNSRRT